MRFFHTLPAFNDPFRGFRQNIVIRFAIEKLELSIYSLTAALDQLRVVASSTSNDPGPRSRQHQQIGQRLLPDVDLPDGKTLREYFARFDTIYECETDRRTDRHRTVA